MMKDYLVWAFTYNMYKLGLVHPCLYQAKTRLLNAGPRALFFNERDCLRRHVTG